MKKTVKYWLLGGAAAAVIITIVTIVIINNNNGGGGLFSAPSATSQVKVGDYVAYEAPTGKSFVLEPAKSGTDKDQTLEVTGKETWRVLSIEDGEVAITTVAALVSKYGDRFEFKGQTGYDNAITTLDSMTKIYTNELARDARSLRLTDIISKMNVAKTAEAVQKKFDHDVDGTGTAKAMYESACKAMNENYGTSRTIGSVTETINNCFSINYTTSEYSLNAFLDNPVYEELFATTYGNNQVADVLLADNIISLRDNKFLNQLFFSYSLPEYKLYPGKGSSFYVGGFDATDWYQYDSSEGVRNPATGRGALKPVVVLKSTVKTSGGNGSAETPWTLSE
ncbi:hypothetical protein IKE72_02845 [Candidatus Saccharibacteria bacterium]|nr:hypothetical protein [Candidatus Saccharibacteria bacterium]